ncbi:uncharacterized protein LOC127840149 isoform X2 [Dreissena polymorpha]|uniref:uncharacterized protein LOC127840149 isoform X2 n=1 Tax=Dreissena polymorpha TaxID=45954 RepID=UPI0022656589|nr:uncharacterized protein LOC127840149 isoform X2 [Dreissena polymorpha]
MSDNVPVDEVEQILEAARLGREAEECHRVKVELFKNLPADQARNQIRKEAARRRPLKPNLSSRKETSDNVPVREVEQKEAARLVTTSAQGSAPPKQSTGVDAKLSAVQTPATKPPLATTISSVTTSVHTAKPQREKDVIHVGNSKVEKTQPADTTIASVMPTQPHDESIGTIYIRASNKIEVVDNVLRGSDKTLSVKPKSKVVAPEDGTFFDMQGSIITANQLPPPPVLMQYGPVQSSKAFDTGPPIPGEDTKHVDEGLLYQDLEISKGTLEEVIQMAEDEGKQNSDVKRGVTTDERLCRGGEYRYIEIGKGAFGTAYELFVGTKKVVTKEVQREKFKKNEVIIPCSSNHPNIVACLGLIVTRTTVEILFEHAGINLEKYWKPYLQKATILNLFSQLISGLKYLHGNGYRHLDIKPGNLCVSTGTDGSVLLKIIDFGSAKMKLEANDFKGMTRLYLAPEIRRYFVEMSRKNEKISELADMFSAGLVLMYMLTGKHVLKEDGMYGWQMQLSGKIVLGSSIEEQFRELITKLRQNLLKDDPSKRWTSSQAWDALQDYVRSPEHCEGIQEGFLKRKAENQTASRTSTDSSVAMDTAIGIKKKISPRGKAATNFEECDTVPCFKKPRLDPENRTKRSMGKVANAEGWKPTNKVVIPSHKAQVMDDEPAVLDQDQAGDQHAGQERHERGLSSGDTSGVTDEGEVHQPTTDANIAADAARDWSMGDPPDDHHKNQQNVLLRKMNNLTV